MVRTLKNYVDGQWKESTSKDFKEVRNPATDELIAKVPLSTKKEVDEAVENAKKAFDEWRNISLSDRLNLLFKYVQVLEKNQEKLAETLTKEHGKNYESALGEIRRTIQMVQGACSTMETCKGDFTENIATNIDEYSVMRPLGVFAMIAPFNFPAMVPWWFAPWAIAVGDTFIIKPNEQCPMTQQKMFELLDEKINLLDGVLNLINGGTEVGKQLISNPDIEGISFVGSTRVGREIYSQAAKKGKRVQCQTGANNFLVVMPDANLKKIMPNIMNACFGNAGQRCLAGSIILGVGDIYEDLKETVIQNSKDLKVGFGLNEDTDVGPVISRDSLNNLHANIEKGIEEGAELLLDGREIEIKEYPNGYFLGPTVFEAQEGMEIFDEEIFGPVICLNKVNSLKEAVDMINRNKYGNASTVYTENGKNAREFRNGVDIGNVGINVGVVAPMSYYPFGGMKDSFFGDLHGQGEDVVRFFADRQIVIRRWYG